MIHYVGSVEADPLCRISRNHRLMFLIHTIQYQELYHFTNWTSKCMIHYVEPAGIDPICRIAGNMDSCSILHTVQI